MLPFPKSLKTKGDDLVRTIEHLVERGLIAEIATRKKALSWRYDNDRGLVGLQLTGKGLAALEPAEQPGETPAEHKAVTRTGTKSATLVWLLQRKQGVPIAEMMSATGWQAPSIRGFLAGALKKRLGMTVTTSSSKSGERRSMSRGDGRNAGRPRSQTEVANEIERIGALDATALRSLWPAWFGKPPPARMRRDMLALALAYRIQCMALGGLSKQAVRELDAVAAKEFGETAVPATDIESIVVREIKSFLSDPMRLIDVVKGVAPGRSLAMAERTKLAEEAATTADHLAGSKAGTARAVILRLVSTVEIASDGVTIIIKPGGLMATLGCETTVPALTETEKPRLRIPMMLRRRGVETKMVLTGDGLPEAEPDETLIRAIARARRWMNDLLEGVYGSIVDLAAAHATSANYVTRHLPLACLAPVIIQSILDGRQPVGLTTWDLLNRIEIPLDWTDQARRLGMC